MSELIGLLILLGVALAMLVAALSVAVVRVARRPPRKTAAYAIARGYPMDPGEAGLSFDTWTLDRPDGVSLPVWDITTEAERSLTAVMVHGWGQSRVDMLARIEPWRSICSRIVTYDMRGHGDAVGLSRLGDGEDDDLRELLTRIGPGPTILVGHSLGATVAIAAAAERVDADVHAVVAIGTYVDFHDALRARLRVMQCPTRPLTDIAMAWFRLRGYRFPSLEAAAGALPCPLLVVHGEHDPICPVEDARRLADAARDGRLVQIDGGGHLDAHEVDEEAHHAAIHEFVRGLGVSVEV